MVDIMLLTYAFTTDVLVSNFLIIVTSKAVGFKSMAVYWTHAVKNASSNQNSYVASGSVNWYS